MIQQISPAKGGEILNKVQKFAAKLILGNVWEEYIQSFLRGDESPVINGQIPINTTSALKYTAVFGCIRVLSETLASMPAMLYRKKADGDREVMTDLIVYDILHNRPNEEMSPFSFKESCMVSLNTGGNTVSEKLFNSVGDLVGLYPYPWSMVTIGRDKSTGKLIYKIRGEFGGNIQEKTLTRDKVFHIPGLSLDGVIGLSPIEYAASAIRLGLAYEKFGNSFYKNGMNPSIALEYPGELSQEAYDRLKKDLDKNYAGLANVGKPFLAEGGAKVKELTIKPADAQLIENKHFQIEDMARIYRVPMHMIQDLTHATFSNVENLSLQFVVYTMLPWAKRWEEAINMQLLTPMQRMQGYYVELNMNSLLRGDLKSRYDAYALGIQWGILSINDCLKLENMNSVEGGDRRIQPLNMISIDKADEYYSIQQNKQNEQLKAMTEKLQMLLERRAA